MFEHIKFPFFGLKKKPFSIEFTLDKIFVVRTEGSHKETVDDRNLQGDYFARLAQMDVRLDFDCTCKDLQQLIYERPKWGMDAWAKSHDMSESIYCRAIKRKVVKTNDNLVWFKSISYPFNIPTDQNLNFDEEIYGILVSVNNEWFIKQFTLDESPIRTKIKI